MDAQPPAGAGLTPVATLRVLRAAEVTLTFEGRLDATGAGVLWTRCVQAAAAAAHLPLVLDLAGVSHCDITGATLLLAAERAHGGEVRIAGASRETAALVALIRDIPTCPTPPGLAVASAWAPLRSVWASVLGAIGFLGEGMVALMALPWGRRVMRPTDVLRIADQAGAGAAVLCVLLGYLMGLIMAFQSAAPIRRFGAELFIANLVAIALLRELGPLLAAVILSGRTGSAFAAELGTMKVNEELDALAVMELDPVAFLVLPRLLAVVVVAPVLALILELAGLAGMVTVMRGLGYALPVVLHQTAGAIHLPDLFGGLFKAGCFGALVAGIGCWSGMSVSHGPRAVGEAATRAVVGGIVASVVLDGVFAGLFYQFAM